MFPIQQKGANWLGGNCCREELAQIGLLLLQAGASVSPRDAAGRQALHAAAEVRASPGFHFTGPWLGAV